MDINYPNKEELFKFLYEDINDFLSSPNKSLKFDILSFKLLEEVLEKFEYEQDEKTWDTNGWQVDFWVDFNHHTLVTLEISGCMYYGDITITKRYDQINK